MTRLAVITATLLAPAMSNALDAQSAAQLRAAAIQRTVARFAGALATHEFAAKDVRHVEFSSDTKRILIAGKKSLAIRDLATGKSVQLRAGDEQIFQARFAPKGSGVLVTGGSTVEIYDDQLAEQNDQIDSKAMFSCVFAQHTPDAKYLVTASRMNLVPGRGAVTIRRLTTDDAPTEIPIHDRWGVRMARMSPRGKYLAVLSGGGKSLLFRLPRGEPIAALDYYYKEPDAKGTRGGWSPQAYTFSRDERLLYIAGTRGIIRAWHIDKAAETRRWRAVTKGAIEFLTTGSDPHTLFSTDARGDVRMWDVHDPRVRRIPLPKPITGRLVFARDRRVFATVWKDKVTVWKTGG